MLIGTNGQITDPRTEFTGGGPGCGFYVNNSEIQSLDGWLSDNDSCALEQVGGLVRINGGRAFLHTPDAAAVGIILQSGAQVIVNGMDVVSDPANSYGSTIKSDNTSAGLGWFARTTSFLGGSYSTKPVYADATTESRVAPFILTDPFDNSPQTLTLTGSTFASPDFYTTPNYILSLTSACPCTVPAPVGPTAGTQGSFKIIQDATGGRTITWNTAFQNPPALNAGANAVTYFGWLANDVGQIILYKIQ